MSQKSALKNRPEPRKEKNQPKPVVAPVVEETVEELSGLDKFNDSLKDNAFLIASIAVAAVLAVIAWGMYQSANSQNESIMWQEFTQSNFVDSKSEGTKNLEQVAKTYIDSPAGVFSALLAGDMQLRTGLAQLGTDREKAMLAFRKAKDQFKMAVDADNSVKSTLTSQRSLYGLAYTNESLGEFDKAKALYQQFIDAAPKAALAESARRGVERCSDEKLTGMFSTFTNYEEEVIGDAPGPSIPKTESPGDFPDVDLEAGTVPPAGDESETKMNADVEAEKKAAAEAEAKAKETEALKAKADVDKVDAPAKNEAPAETEAAKVEAKADAEPAAEKPAE
jgi:tetratricopeptide (TPR) repeat protein